jgi:hypothetical protein
MTLFQSVFLFLTWQVSGKFRNVFRQGGMKNTSMGVDKMLCLVSSGQGDGIPCKVLLQIRLYRIVEGDNLHDYCTYTNAPIIIGFWGVSVYPGFMYMNCSIERIYIALQSPYTCLKYRPFSQSSARLAQISSGSFFFCFIFSPGVGRGGGTGP